MSYKQLIPFRPAFGERCSLKQSLRASVPAPGAVPIRSESPSRSETYSAAAGVVSAVRLVVRNDQLGRRVSKVDPPWAIRVTIATSSLFRKRGLCGSAGTSAAAFRPNIGARALLMIEGALQCVP